MRLTEYQPGVPCWVDLGSPDLAATRAFYTALFGWTAHTAPEEQSGGYTIFHKDDLPVAAAGPLMAPQQPPAWTWYGASTDVEQTARRVEAAGGKVLMAPFDIMGQGRMAVFADTAGTPFSAWQAQAFVGAQLANEHGTFTWNELMTRSPGGLAEFYGEVFGWTAKISDDPAMPYTEFQLDGRSIAGLMPMVGDAWPADLPDRWVIYFAVDDCDATCARIRELGGTVTVGPIDLPKMGRFASASDNVGAVFSVIAMAG